MTNTIVENLKLELLAQYEIFDNAQTTEVATAALEQIEKLNKEINELLFPTEKTEIEIIAEQLFEQGFYSKEEEGTLTVTGLDYDLSISPLEKGFALETYCTNPIEHFKTYEWANYKEVKTLKGLNGYLRKFGFGTVQL